MFITDFDGTLFRSDHTLDARDVEMMERLGEEGILRVIATGRSLYSLERAVKGGLPVDYIIFSTGAGIASYPDPNRHILARYTLSEEETGKISDLFEGLGFDYMIHRPVPDNHVFTYRKNGHPNSDFTTRLNFYNGFHRPIENDADTRVPSAQVLAIVPGDGTDFSLDEIRNELSAFTVIRATSPFDGKTTWIEVFPREVSKSRAASWLGARYGISAGQVVAVGNDYNDEDLLEWAGRRYVVENAPDDLKCRFSVVASNNDCGVAQVIEEILGR